jgi:hypothetical protein
MTSETETKTRARPSDWEPPYPAGSSRFDADVTTVVMGYLGVQAADEADLAAPLDRLRGFLAAEGGPDHLDQARIFDTAQHHNEVLIAYWLDPAHFAAWRTASGFDAWWRDPARAQGAAGLWLECLQVPLERLETIAPISRKYQYGIARAATNHGEPVREHGYFGSMRDRIPASATDAFAPADGGALAPRSLPDSRGRRLVVQAPKNLALIRSGQDWTGCRDAERAMYVDTIHPLLETGMAYLRDNPVDSGCASCRFMTEVTPDGEARTATFGLAYFLSLGHLEEWASHHPTHLAIFRSFHALMRLTNATNKLKLWHEVSVLGGGGDRFEYVNCHPRTGLLPWFASHPAGD